MATLRPRDRAMESPRLQRMIEGEDVGVLFERVSEHIGTPD